MILEKGTPAPDFELSATPDQKLKRSDFLGKNLILVFYPADWSPVCGDQVALYNEMLSIFRKHNADILGISVDSAWCHDAFMADRKLHYPLLADFHPKGEISKAYGAYNDENGTSKRALFVIDKDGIIQWSYLSPDGINPGADGIIDALEELNKNS